MGYTLGCLFSILFWNFNREMVVEKTIRLYHREKKNIMLWEVFLFSAIFIGIFFILGRFLNREVFNFLTAFLVLYYSSKEKENKRLLENGDFERAVINICDGLVGGLICPLMLMLLIGNTVAISYMFLTIINMNFSNKYLSFFMNIVNIIPGIICDIFIICLNVFSIKRIRKVFAAKNIKYIILEPMHFVNILYSHLYGFSFYCYAKDDKGALYIEEKGSLDGDKIDKKATDRLLNHGYIICLICFIIFIAIYTVLNKK